MGAPRRAILRPPVVEKPNRRSLTWLEAVFGGAKSCAMIARHARRLMVFLFWQGEACARRYEFLNFSALMIFFL